jgi:flagellar hook-associated protein 1 FlgK
MSGVLNIGVLALQANQSALQTTGNNIANVNTPGYSRQNVVLQSIQGQATGSGYFGKGVDVRTVTRNYNEFLTRQSTISQSITASDKTRVDQLGQLENLLQTGSNGLGSGVADMLNSFSDIVSAPTDLTARSVALTRSDEVASRFRNLSNQIDQLRVGNQGQLKTDAIAINTLAKQIGKTNQDIARAMGTGNSPNDLLDQRDQLVRDLNRYVQTSSIIADDGTMGIFLANSQALVLGTTVAPVSVVNDSFNNPTQAKLAITVAGKSITLDEHMLGGGEVSGLLRFQNTDLAEASNLLGRMALSIGSKMNEQQTLGLDLTGTQGSSIFNLASMPKGFPAKENKGTATVSVSPQTQPSDAASFVASDYEVVFDSASTGTLTRLSDGVKTKFDFNQGVKSNEGADTHTHESHDHEDGHDGVKSGDASHGKRRSAMPEDGGKVGKKGSKDDANTKTPNSGSVKIDGLEIHIDSGTAAVGDRFVLKPFSTAAGSIAIAFSSPKGLAMANPVSASAGASNAGTLAMANLAPRSMPIPTTPVTLTFTGPGTFTRSDDEPANSVAYSYTPDQPIEYESAPPASGWALTLKGVPQAGDTYTVGPNLYPQLNAGNAEAMLGLRDAALFDGGPLTDGYASAIALIGTRMQSAQSSYQVSQDISTNLERDRTAVSGVNLDEEAARMIQYQQAYQAAGKMMQVAQTLFDSLLQTVN